MGRLSVLHVAEVLKGGTASYIDELLEYQAEKFGAATIHVLVPASQVGDLAHAGSVYLHTFEDKSSRLVHVLRIRRAFKQLVEKNAFDIVHIHGTFAGFAIRLFFGWKRIRPKLIYCAHGWAFDREATSWKNWIIGFVEKFLSKWSDVVICISDHDFRSAVRIGIRENKLVIIKSGISCTVVSSDTVEWPDCKRRFLFAGRFDRQKGVDLFVDAMRIIGSDGFAFAIGDASVGDESLSSPPDNVKVTGWLPRSLVQSYLESSDVFVMPSRWEGFGLSALEAMRAGRPVIASRVGGLPELVLDGLNGVLVEPNSAIELAHAMRNITDQSISVMGKASRERFEAFFTSDRLNREVEELYLHLIKHECSPFPATRRP